MPPKQMTTAHKEAMAAGRKEGQAVKAYLDALQQHAHTPTTAAKLQYLDPETAACLVGVRELPARGRHR